MTSNYNKDYITLLKNTNIKKTDIAHFLCIHYNGINLTILFEWIWDGKEIPKNDVEKLIVIVNKGLKDKDLNEKLKNFKNKQEPTLFSVLPGTNITIVNSIIDEAKNAVKKYNNAISIEKNAKKKSMNAFVQSQVSLKLIPTIPKTERNSQTAYIVKNTMKQWRINQEEYKKSDKYLKTTKKAKYIKTCEMLSKIDELYKKIVSNEFYKRMSPSNIDTLSKYKDSYADYIKVEATAKDAYNKTLKLASDPNGNNIKRSKYYNSAKHSNATQTSLNSIQPNVVKLALEAYKIIIALQA